MVSKSDRNGFKPIRYRHCSWSRKRAMCPVERFVSIGNRGSIRSLLHLGSKSYELGRARIGRSLTSEIRTRANTMGIS